MIASLGFPADASGDRGEDHVDFSIDSGDADLADVKGQSHVCFSVSPLSAHTIEVMIAPGETGAGIVGLTEGADGDTIDGEKGNGHVDFRVTIGPDGCVRVNGEDFAACDPADGCWISLAWSADAGAFAVQVEDASGAICAGQFAMAEAPSEIEITAAEVRDLSVASQ